MGWPGLMSLAPVCGNVPCPKPLKGPGQPPLRFRLQMDGGSAHHGPAVPVSWGLPVLLTRG